jgi:beta-glucosidase
MAQNRPSGSINTAAHSKAVYDIAAESIVLLKNEKQLLPLKTGSVKSIAVIGDNAVHRFSNEGFGAGVKARYEVNALQGIQQAFDKTTDIQFAQGYLAPKTGSKNSNGAKPEDLVSEAVAKAKSCEIAIVFIGGNRDYESESRDRKDLSLPFGEQALVDAVTAANPNTIVVITGGAPYDINAIKKNNHTIVWNWYNGSENGNALADVLTGKINPSGKLPFSFPVTLEQSPAHYLKTFPGANKEANYKEGILVGYRWYDTKKIEPMYPFGYGLSYTTFEYTGLKSNSHSFGQNETITATVSIKNTGKTAGKETVQLYVSKSTSVVVRAAKELKAFEKLLIGPGETKMVTLNIPVKDLAYYDEKTGSWIVERGDYELIVGSSSKDIKGKVEIKVM